MECGTHVAQRDPKSLIARHLIVIDAIMVSADRQNSDAWRHQADIVAWIETGIRTVVLVHHVVVQPIAATQQNGIRRQDEHEDAGGKRLGDLGSLLANAGVDNLGRRHTGQQGAVEFAAGNDVHAGAQGAQ